MMFFLDAAQQGSWGLFFGRFHPLLVHLPIGMLLIAFILEWMSRSRRLAVVGAAVLPVLVFGALSAVAACIAGLLLSASGGYDEGVLNLHMWLGIGVAVISIGLCFLHKYAFGKKAWLPLSAFMIVLLSAAGHYGGTLTHGDDYLTAALPLGKKSGQNNTVADLEKAKVYHDLVRPILEQKCYGCHNAQKLKGGLRLDDWKEIGKGGENGPVLKDSLPELSELYKRLILPEDHDKRMPPKGKPQLTPQQLEIIYWWIEQGASPDALVKDLRKSSRMQLVFEGMQSSGEAGQHPDLPEDLPAAPSPTAVNDLHATGAKVMPVAEGNAFVMVNAVNAADFGNREAALLLPLKAQIAWLKLGRTQLTDSALGVISQLPHLTRLQLEYTAVTDAGMSVLAKAPALKSLNLVGTKVTAAGLKALRANKSLREVYVYQSAVAPADVAALQKEMPDVRIDTGGYHVARLDTDTMVFRKK
ncbi:c-type cytochrome domain-containing protein [Chitinophaga lutea]